MRSPDYSALPEGAMPVPNWAPKPPANPYEGQPSSLRPLAAITPDWLPDRREDGLTDLERAVLDLEHNSGNGWPHPDHAAKHAAVFDTLGLSMTRFTQILLRLVDTQAAQAHNPVLCHRIQDRRARARLARESPQRPTA